MSYRYQLGLTAEKDLDIFFSDFEMAETPWILKMCFVKSTEDISACTDVCLYTHTYVCVMSYILYDMCIVCINNFTFSS